MAKKWILTAPTVRNPMTGQRGASALVHSQADLDRRLAEARKAGVKVTVRPVKN
jgi:hypothetical protein